MSEVRPHLGAKANDDAFDRYLAAVHESLKEYLSILLILMTRFKEHSMFENFKSILFLKGHNT